MDFTYYFLINNQEYFGHFMKTNSKNLTGTQMVKHETIVTQRIEGCSFLLRRKPNLTIKL